MPAEAAVAAPGSCALTPAPARQVIEELKGVLAYRERELGKASEVLAICLSARRNLCVARAGPHVCVFAVQPADRRADVGAAAASTRA